MHAHTWTWCTFINKPREHAARICVYNTIDIEFVLHSDLVSGRLACELARWRVTIRPTGRHTTTSAFRWWCWTYYSDQLKPKLVPVSEQPCVQAIDCACLMRELRLIDVVRIWPLFEVANTRCLLALTNMHDVQVCNKENLNLLPDKVYIWDKRPRVFICTLVEDRYAHSDMCVLVRTVVEWHSHYYVCSMTSV